MDQWLCTSCGKLFVHARLLARHWREIHNRRPACQAAPR
jgi:hypothetical protein